MAERSSMTLSRMPTHTNDAAHQITRVQVAGFFALEGSEQTVFFARGIRTDSGSLLGVQKITLGGPRMSATVIRRATYAPCLMLLPPPADKTPLQPTFPPCQKPALR